MDLFENIDSLPTKVQNLINSFDNDFTYDNCDNLLIKLTALGYTFDYGLDATPFNLHKITLTEDDFDDVVVDEDGSKWSQVCCGHADQVNYDESTDDFVGEGSSGICGVKGCDVESEHYIDFR